MSQSQTSAPIGSSRLVQVHRVLRQPFLGIREVRCSTDAKEQVPLGIGGRAKNDSSQRIKDAVGVLERTGQGRPTMHRRIGVWGICDTGGLTAVLRTVFPQDTIVPLIENVDITHSVGQLEILVTPFWRQASEGILEMERCGRLRIIRYPPVVFRAFHPDLFYVYRKSGHDLTEITPPYNSGICAWCYFKGIPAERTTSLFTREVFSALGYFSQWDVSVANLKAEHEKCGFDFRSFYLKVKRHGAFMHSINHPKPVALIELGKQIAMKLGAPQEILDEPIEIVDALAHINWPVYPEIGEYYGLRTAYRWMPDQPEAPPLGLADFIEKSYRAYAELDLKYEDIFFEGMERCEAVLRPRVEE